MELLDHQTGDWETDPNRTHEHRDHVLTFSAPHDFSFAPLFELVNRYNSQDFIVGDGIVPAGHGLCTDLTGDRNADTFKIEVTIRESNLPYSQNTILNGIDLGRSIYDPADFSILAA
jgi:hypothetical protein